MLNYKFGGIRLFSDFDDSINKNKLDTFNPK